MKIQYKKNEGLPSSRLLQFKDIGPGEVFFRPEGSKWGHPILRTRESGRLNDCVYIVSGVSFVWDLGPNTTVVRIEGTFEYEDLVTHNK